MLANNRFWAFLFLFIITILTLLPRNFVAYAAGPNLIQNPSVEQNSSGDPTSWTKGNWGTNSPVFTYNINGQSGSRSVTVKIDSYTSGDAKWAFNHVNVSPSTSYTYSDYYKSNVQSEIVVEVADQTGQFSYFWLGSLNSSSSWKKATFNFTTPSYAKSLTVYHFINRVGSLQTDNFSLTANSTPTPSPSALYTSTASANPTTVARGNSFTVYSSITSTQAFTGLVDIEAYDPAGNKVFQQFFDNQTFVANQPKTFSANFTTTQANSLGNYRITVGVFGNNWNGLKDWNDNASQVTLTQSGPAPTEPPVVITGNVPNNSVEQASVVNPGNPVQWSKSTWGTNQASFTYLSNLGHTGSKSVKTEISSYNSGDAKWYYNSQPVLPNQKLRFTDYYQSNVTSQVVVEVLNNDGSLTYLGLKSAPASASWAKYSDTFTTPANAKSITVFHLISTVGFLITDDYSVTTYQPEGFNRALVTLTFDDGWASQYETGKPVMDSHNFRGTYYITTGFLGTSGYMTNSMVTTLYGQGNEIDAHTIDHPHLPTLSDSELDRQLYEPQTYLQSLGITANDFATPFGDADQRVIDHSKVYYRTHRGVLTDYNYKDSTDFYNLKVQNIQVDTPTSEVQAWIDQAKLTNSWLILVYHQVDHGGDQWSVTPENFTAQMNVLDDSDVAVVTLDQALAEVIPQINQ